MFLVHLYLPYTLVLHILNYGIIRLVSFINFRMGFIKKINLAFFFIYTFYTVRVCAHMTHMEVEFWVYFGIISWCICKKTLKALAMLFVGEVVNIQI